MVRNLGKNSTPLLGLPIQLWQSVSSLPCTPQASVLPAAAMSVTEGKFAMLPALEYLRLMAERGRRQLNKPQNLFSLCSALPTEGLRVPLCCRAAHAHPVCAYAYT